MADKKSPVGKTIGDINKSMQRNYLRYELITESVAYRIGTAPDRKN
ncbi:hypothetical protein FAES_pFAES01015 (plasmid) [Fibrella aestuarina BUZ 2]|uniref:Uncharacterized protein n=1 Tax=Fibrella aestuarina BUZ 2 TaxID=1166018 RepID=I0KHA6_9BACT|nr:hypothetical protein FAES_pFAES01015 [Fibrella aestuarina BUZ 2]